jgi:hypothetical protein
MSGQQPPKPPWIREYRRERVKVIFGCFLGVAILVFAFLRDYEQREIASWPTVTGYVIKDSVYSSSASYRQVFRQRITYQYSSYSCSRLYSHWSNAGEYWQNELDAALALPQIGSEMTVYYNPKAAADAIVYPDPLSDRSYWILIFMGLGFLGIGLLRLPSVFDWNETVKATPAI